MNTWIGRVTVPLAIIGVTVGLLVMVVVPILYAIRFRVATPANAPS